ncbi:MAG: hypothetical protein Tsb004_28030 [Allomuricauda sp.]
MENLTTKSHGKMMANHLKEILGIDPLTVSQYQLTESFNSEDNNPYFNAIRSNEPSILVDDQGNSFAGSSKEPWCDIWLYHPKTQYVHSRPKWLGWVQNKKWVDIPKYNGDLTYPLMVLAYSVDEDKEDAIPIDIVILEDGSTKKKMSLFAHGSYDLIYMDSNNQCFSKRMSTN